MSRPERVDPASLALFASLYAVQGVVVAYLINFNKSYMIAAGVDEVTVGWVETAVLMTLVFKFVLGPLSDRVNLLGQGHRRPYILLGLGLQALGLIGLAKVDPGRHLAGFAIMAFSTVVGLSLYDTCCDGWVVDVTPADDRARVQGTLQVARFLTTMVATLGFGHWIRLTGIGPRHSEGVLWACAALSLVPLVQALLRRESGRIDAGEEFRWSALGAVVRPHALLLLAFGALYGMVGLGVEFNLSRYYIALGFDQGDVGTFGAIRYAGRAAGAILLPALKSRVGRTGQLALGLLALALTTAGQTQVAGELGASCWAFALGMANGWNDALFCVLAMEASDPRMAASTFSIFMAISNLSVVGDALFVEALRLFRDHYRPVLLISAGLALGLLALVPPLVRTTPKPSGVGDALA